MMTSSEQILNLNDMGESVAEIAALLQKSPGYVYDVLRQHRPARPRKVHARGARHFKIADMYFLHKKTVREIAKELDISRSCVYRHLPKTGETDE